MFDKQQIIQQINQELANWQQPSMAFGVVKDGEVLLADGFGYADKEKGKKANGDTLYQIGSCSKAFTSAAVAKLVDEGKLAWDEKVITYLPYFSYQDEMVTPRLTIRDLLCHRTGLPRHDFYWITNELTRQDMVTSMSRMNACWSLRSHWFYNNFCFVVAGVLIEKVSGLTWEEYLTENFLKPLGMNRTFFYVEDMVNDDNAALAYSLKPKAKDGEYEAVDYMKFKAENKATKTGAPFGPAGSIISCINDMVKWVNFHLSDGSVDGVQIISKANMDELHRPQMLLENALINDWPETDFYSYGLGWFTQSYRGYRMVEHGGNITGMSAIVCMIPEKKIGCVGLVNFNGSFVHYAQSFETCDRLLEAEEVNWHERFRNLFAAIRTPEAQKAAKEKMYGARIENTTPTHPLEAYTGKYHNKMYGDAEVSIKDNSLFIKMGIVESKLEHYHYNAFTLVNPDCMLYDFNINFRIDKTGMINSFESEIAMPAATEVYVKVKGE